MLKRTISYIFSISLSVYQLAGQASSESPYSDQAYDPAQNPAWYETPFLWAGLLLVLLLVFFWLRKRRKKI